MSRRRRRTQSTPAESEVPEQANQNPVPEDDAPTDEEIEQTPAEQEAIASEDAALEDFEQAVRDGVEELPPEGREAELVAGPQDPVQIPGEENNMAPLLDEGPGFYPRPSDVERDVDNFMDTFPNPVAAPPIPDFEEIFERGPLAAGIRMLEALLTEARIGYIDAQVDELARVTEEDFTEDERRILAEIAEAERSESGLPGVAAAYRTLVRLRAQVDA